jgi:hypothetical protein
LALIESEPKHWILVLTRFLKGEPVSTSLENAITTEASHLGLREARPMTPKPVNAR